MSVLSIEFAFRRFCLPSSRPSSSDGASWLRSESRALAKKQRKNGNPLCGAFSVLPHLSCMAIQTRRNAQSNPGRIYSKSHTSRRVAFASSGSRDLRVERIPTRSNGNMERPKVVRVSFSHTGAGYPRIGFRAQNVHGGRGPASSKRRRFHVGACCANRGAAVANANSSTPFNSTQQCRQQAACKSRYMVVPT